MKEKKLRNFFSIWKNSKPQIIKLINLTSDGTYADKPNDMLNCTNAFYSELYKCDNISLEDLNEIIYKIEKKPVPKDIYSDLESNSNEDEVKRGHSFQWTKLISWPGWHNCRVLPNILAYYEFWY